MKTIKKIWVPLVIVAILAIFIGVIYYNNEISPKKKVDKEIGYTPEDYITLGQYKGLKYDQSEAGVSEEELEEAIAEELIDYKEVDRKAKEGDSVNIDYTAFVDGSKDDNLSEVEFDILIGDADLAEEFDEAVVGKKAGDKVKVEVSDVSAFPTDEEIDYTGKTIQFEITVNTVSEEFTAELTDDWVKENYGEDYECNTVEEYKELMKESLMEDSESTVEEDTQTDLWDMVMNNCVMNSYPQELYDEIVAVDDADMAYWADYWGMTVEEYYEFLEMDESDIEEMYLNDVKSELVMWAIAKAEGIEVTSAEIEQGYEDMYEDYDYESADAMKADYDEDEIKHALIEQKVIEFVVDNAKITEVPSVKETEESEE